MIAATKSTRSSPVAKMVDRFSWPRLTFSSSRWHAIREHTLRVARPQCEVRARPARPAIPRGADEYRTQPGAGAGPWKLSHASMGQDPVEHCESRRGRPSRTETSCRYRREPCARIGGRYLRRLPSMKHYVKRFSEPAGALVGASVGARFHPTLARCQGLDSHFLQARCTIKRPRVSLDHSVR